MFFMQHHHVRVKINEFPCQMCSITKLHILYVHKNVLIKSMKLLKHIPPDQKKPSFYPVNLLNTRRTPIQQPIPLPADKQKKSIAKRVKFSNRCLPRSIKITQLPTQNCNIWMFFGILTHFYKSFVFYYCVIIKKKNEFSCGIFCAHITSSPKASIAGISNHPHVCIFFLFIHSPNLLTEIFLGLF